MSLMKEDGIKRAREQERERERIHRIGSQRAQETAVVLNVCLLCVCFWKKRIYLKKKAKREREYNVYKVFVKEAPFSKAKERRK